MQTDTLYLGTMSGTSLDGLDIVACTFQSDGVNVEHASCLPFPDTLREQLHRVACSSSIAFADYGRVNHAYSAFCAAALKNFLAKAGIESSQVAAVGHHGQTVHHAPENHISLQMTDNHLIAAQTGIPIIGDFRQKDLALGGQGAPLAPALHMLLATRGDAQVFLNLGGIANITAIRKNGQAFAFDTGPGNGLMDAWAQQHLGQHFDAHGAWAATANYDSELLLRLKGQPYFRMPHPKSTGRELFNTQWLLAHLEGLNLAPAVVQATLLELTAETVCDAIKTQIPEATTVYACGGGVHNSALMTRLQELLSPVHIGTTNERGIDPDWVEACAFALLAKLHMEKAVVDLGTITGASRPYVPGIRFDPE